MQSDTQPKRNPYLSQYKSNISSQQRLIRQRLDNSIPAQGSNPDANKQDLDNLPPIDDELEQHTHERHQKIRYSYFDDEAEKSLQFFKKNLLPSSNKKIETKQSTSSLLDKQTVSSSNIKTDSTNVTQARAPLEVFESSKTSTNNYKYPVVLTKPVPFKQTVLNEPRFERQSVLATPTQTKTTFSNNNNSQPSQHVSSSSRTSIDKITTNNLTQNRPRSSERHKQSSSERKGVPADQAELARAVRTNSPKVPDSPIPAETFARKPLYNSLLRAHDSIRLKVNRPKVRPKSETVVDDTEIDDSIQLAEINSVQNLNERAVDVKQSSKRKSKKKDAKSEEKGDEDEKLPIRNFSEVRVVKVVRSESERSLGVTVKVEDNNIVVARILAGSLADKQGALQVGDVILSVNNREVYTPEQLQEQLRMTINEDTVILKIVPSFREELPTLCIYLRALFNYDPNEDSLLPCKEVGVSFNQGDILEVVNQEDPNWWQARRVDSENLQTGLIPSQELEERRRAFVIPDYDLATRTSICGTKVSRKSKKKEIYNVGQNCDFDRAELQLYEEVCRTPAFERRTLVLIGANGVGKQALKARLIAMDPERFGTPLPHTSRLPREGEEDGIHYHFVTREKMEEDIINGKYLEYGEYDGALYGTKLDSVREIIGSGKVCVLDCSPTCLKILKTSDYLPFVAFIAAPTLDQLRYMHEWNRGNKTYATFDRALSRQSRRAKTLQDFAFDFFEDEDLQLTVEESARLFRMYENYFDIFLVNNHFERTFEQLRDAIDALSMAPQWIPISWIYGT